MDPAKIAAIKEGLDDALKGAEADVGLKLDPAEVAAVKESLDKALGGEGLKVSLDDTEAMAELGDLDGQLADLRSNMDHLRLNIDDLGAEASLARLQVQAAALAKSLAKAGDGADMAPLEARLLALQAAFAKLAGAKVNLDDADAAEKLTALAADAGRIRLQLDSLRATVSDSDAVAKIAALQAAAVKLSRSLVVAPNDADLAPFDAQLTKIAAGYEAIRDASAKEDEEIKTQTGLFASLGLAGPGSLIHITDILNASLPEVKLYGGAVGALYKSMTGSELPSFANHLVNVASSAHLTAEAAIEFTAVWGPALIGLAAFSAAAVPTLIDVGVQLKNMKTVTEATNQQFKNLSSNQSAIANAVKPEVMQLFGEYLVAAGNGGDHLAVVLKAIGNVLDDFGAKIDQVLASNGTSKFLDKAAGDIQGLGTAFTQVGRIIGDLLQDVPGYAEILLKLGDAALTAIADIVKFVNPAIKYFLLLHGAVFYVGLASTALINLGKAAVGAFSSIVAGTGAAEGAEGFFAKLGQSLGNLAGSVTNGAKAVVTFVKGIAGIDTLAGVSTTITSLEEAMKGMTEADGSAEGIAALSSAIEGLKSATASAAAMTALDDALEGLKDAEGAELAVTALAAGVEGLKDASEAATAVGVLGKAMDAVPFGAFGLLAVGVAAVIGVGLYAAMHQAASAAEQLGAQMTKLISSSNIVNVQQNIMHATEATSAQISQQAKALGGLYASTSKVGTQQVNLHTGEYTQLGGAISGVTGNLQADQRAQAAYASQNAATALRVSALGKSYGDTATQSELFTLAGVKQSDVVNANAAAWALDMIKVKATAEAYGIMGTQAGQAGHQLDTITISTGNVTKAMQTLTGAESQWLSLITGGDSAFSAFEQGMSTLKDSMAGGSAAGVKLTTASGKLTEQQKLLASSLTGTSTSALAARQSFDSQIQSAGTLYGNLQNLAAASGNTKKSTAELAASGKDLVAQLLPVAQGSKEATAEVYALAQMVGYNGPQSFSAMTQWLGKTTGAEKDLNKQQALLTESSADLSKAAQNLAGALTSDVTAAQSKALLSTTQFQASQNTLINTLQQSKGNMTATASAAGVSYYNALVKAGLGTSQARAYLDALLQKLQVTPAQIAQVNASLNTMTGQVGTTKDAFIQFAENGLKLTQTQAEALWSTNKAQNLVDLASKATTTETQFANLAEKGLHVTASQAQSLWTTLRQQYLDTVASKAGETQKAFEGVATQFGLTKGQADKLYQSLRSISSGSPYTALVSVQEKLVETTTELTTGKSGVVPGVSKAAGGLIRHMAGGGFTVHGMAGGGASGQDSVHAMLAPGELVIPASHAPAFRDQARKASIPGFDGGGYVGDLGTQSYAPVIADPSAYVSGSAAGSSGMPPANQYGQQQQIVLLQAIARLLQQQPYTISNAVNSAVGTGVRRGYYATGS